MSRRYLLLLLLTAIAVPAAARADGGVSIAAAPDLPIGEQVTGGVARLDFWRLNVTAGDKLVINYSSTDGSVIQFCFMQPGVTDYTLVDASCWKPQSTDTSSTKRQTSRIMPTSGRWTLVVGAYWDCVTESYVRVGCTKGIGYELTAYLLRATRTTLTAPARVVKASRPLVLQGTVSAGATGNLAIQQRIGATWKNVAVAPLGKNGAFRVVLRLARPGRYVFRAYYPGDGSHRGSVAAVAVTAV